MLNNYIVDLTWMSVLFNLLTWYITLLSILSLFETNLINSLKQENWDVRLHFMSLPVFCCYMYLYIIALALGTKVGVDLWLCHLICSSYSLVCFVLNCYIIAFYIPFVLAFHPDFWHFSMQTIQLSHDLASVARCSMRMSLAGALNLMGLRSTKKISVFG